MISAMIPQGLFGLGTAELIIIAVVILVFAGGARLVGLGKASGKAIREFKEELTGDKPSEEAPDSAES